MQPPFGSTIPTHKVCKLQRALYGLKQAPRAWFAKFSATIHDFGFTSSPYDSALFIRTTAQGTTLLFLYVDDMIITGDDEAGILHLKQFLSQHFEMKDLGTFNYFLGLEISHDSSGYFLSQAKYASDFLARVALTDCKTASTPINPQTRLTPLDGTLLLDATLCWQLVGSLIYLTVTRPNLSYAVHITLTARSSTEAEYRALTDTTQELLWLHWLLVDMGVASIDGTSLYCDNQSAIQIAYNDVFHDRTKHIEIHCHFIHQHVTRGTVQLHFIASADQPADIFTKAHPPGPFSDLVSKLIVNSTLTTFDTIGLASCNLSELPNFLREQTRLRSLDLSNNKIHGEVPKWLFNVGKDSLQNLNLSHNFLISLERLPWKNLCLSSLLVLDLSNNSLSGLIPQCLGNLSNNLSVLNLGINSFSSTFTATFTKELQVLVLRFNRFHGHIGTFTTKSKHPFPKLRIIDISYNEFTRLLPTNYIKQFEAMTNVDEHELKLKYMGEYYYQDSVVVMMKGYEIEYSRILTVFSIIDLSRNKFQGEILKSIEKLNSLRGLNLSRNNLTGHIPTSLGKLTNLESLDLSLNEFVGKIPQQLASLTFLEVLNLSDNQLVGRIPQGSQFNTFGNDSYNGNLALCGFPLSKICEKQQPLPPSPTLQHDENSDWEGGFNWKVLL
ncbi:receptor-like protein 18 [Camellia sinensis]|uniref:receptor-like protein 18 n=1 Tax=Camellia sinensis TaxID=4442 RepID=UPI001035B676|nr:receptor-like protein 18 [Camellia sinensis]